jgi:glycerol-3-phosphate dehydrogenase
VVATSILTSALSPAYRQRVISELSKEEFDLLVIGGGVNGAGIALDAASRGLSVALVEANDFASGTSSRSSKLIHGGLRYLEQYDFKLVREALQERELMITTIAPHLVRPVSFLYPLQEKLKERTYVGAGMALYDALRGFKRALPWHKHVSQKELSEIAPSLRLDLITGGYRYFDAQVDDARHTMMIARTAAKYGALVGTRIKCESLLKEGKRIVGAKVRDLITDKEIVVKARVTVMATGVWTDEMYKSFGIKPGYKVRTSKGAHIVVPGDAIKSQSGVIIKTDNSVLFIIPWAGKWIVGTTDTDYKDELAEPVATRADIDYIIHQANRVLEPKLDKSQVIGAFAGLRPLISQEDNAETADLSREHVIDHPVPGFVTIAGGKYTTYRVMSEDAVNEAVSDLNRIIPDSCTDSLSVIGADGYAVLKNQVKRLANTYQIDVNTVTHLLERYGSLIAEVLDSSPLEYLEKLSPDLPYLKAEIWYAVTHEGALSISDVMYRRTRLNFELKDQGISLLDEIAAIVATALGWDMDKKEESMKQYRDLVARQEMARFN